MQAGTVTPDGQVVLEEQIDESYEPSQQEILEYAQWLGMDVEKEKELLWIAKEGLKAPLPQPWKPCKTPEGDIYYFNFGSGESIWDHPCDKQYKQLYQDEKAKWLKQQQEKKDDKKGSSNEASKATPSASQNSEGAPKKQLDQKSEQVLKPLKVPGADTASISGDILAGILPSSREASGGGAGMQGLAPLKALGLSKLSPLKSASNSLSASGSDWPNVGSALGQGGRAGFLGMDRTSSSGGAALPDVPAATSPTGNGKGVSNLGANAKADNVQADNGASPLRKAMNGLSAVNTVQSTAKATVASSDVTVTPSASSAYDSGTPGYSTITDTTKAGTYTSTSAFDESEEADALKSRYAERLRDLKDRLSREEAAAKKQLEEGSELVLAEFRRQLEAREARVREEASLAQRRQLMELEDTHAAAMAELKKKHAEAQDKLQEQIQAKQREIQELGRVCDEDKRTAQAVALKVVQEEAQLWAEAQKATVRHKILDDIHAQIEEEIRPLRNSRLEEALKLVDSQVEAAVAARKQEMSSLSNQVADQRRVLEKLEEQVSEMRTQLKAKSADIEACEAQLPKTERDLSTKQRELSTINSEVATKSTELSSLAAQVASKQADLSAMTRQLEDSKQQAADLAAEIHTHQEQLQRLKNEASSHAAQIEAASVKHASSSINLADLDTAVQDKKAALADLDKAVQDKQQELTALTTSLAKARASSLTQDLSLASELRNAAGAEFGNLEAELARVRAELAVASPELSTTRIELASCSQALDILTRDLVDKQRRQAQVTVELSQAQVQLSEVQSELVSNRHQLDMVSQLLLSQQRSLDEARHTAVEVSEERDAMLAAARQRMYKDVEGQVAQEQAQLLATKLAQMQRDVEQQITQGLSTPSQWQQQQSSQQQQSDPRSFDQANASVPGSIPRSSLVSIPATASPVPAATQPRVGMHTVRMPSVGGVPEYHNMAAAQVPAMASLSTPVQQQPSHQLHQEAGSEQSKDNTIRLDPLLQKSLELLITQAGILAQRPRYEQSSEDGTNGPPTSRTAYRQQQHQLQQSWASKHSAGNAARHGDMFVANQGGHPNEQAWSESGLSSMECGTMDGAEQVAHHGVHAAARPRPSPSPKARTRGTPLMEQSAVSLAPWSDTVQKAQQLQHQQQLLQQEQQLRDSKVHLKQQKRLLKERQAAVEAAIAEWRTSEAVNKQEDPSTRKHNERLLRNVKAVLEEQVNQINEEQTRLSEQKAQVHDLEKQCKNLRQQMEFDDQQLQQQDEMRPRASRSAGRSMSASRSMRQSLDRMERVLTDVRSTRDAFEASQYDMNGRLTSSARSASSSRRRVASAGDSGRAGRQGDGADDLMGSLNLTSRAPRGGVWQPVTSPGAIAAMPNNSSRRSTTASGWVSRAGIQSSSAPLDNHGDMQHTSGRNMRPVGPDADLSSGSRHGVGRLHMPSPHALEPHMSSSMSHADHTDEDSFEQSIRDQHASWLGNFKSQIEQAKFSAWQSSGGLGLMDSLFPSGGLLSAKPSKQLFGQASVQSSHGQYNNVEGLIRARR